GAWRDIAVRTRAELGRGETLEGPALVLEDHCTTFVAPAWRCRLDEAGALLLERDRDASAARAVQPDVAEQVEAVRTELFAGRLAAIAEEMGEVLQRTALSTNVKERLDFSCTVLDASGELVVNAPHMPVHLGALGLCVREVVAALPLGPGDVAVTNHPRYGGSHLPDITVITSVHDEHDTLLGYVASRAHHAEIGGKRPGSMPPDATLLVEEGVVIAPRYLVRGEHARWDELEALLRAGSAPSPQPSSAQRWPSRAVADNIADLRAAVAANHLGASALRAIASERGTREVAAAMADLKARAEREVRRALSELDDGSYHARTHLDDGAELAVCIDIAGDRARVDFSGSAGVHPGNLNATPAIVRGAVIYVLRLLVDRPLPLNEGLMAAVELVLPHGMLSPDFSGADETLPAVVGGNVETSQRLCDILLEALGLMAHSQGTMNNFLFGSDRFGYYETICGGHGASADGPGTDAVHTHMTNTRITDVEVLEQRYPVRLERFAVRRGSGGNGAHRGGDGAVREVTFLAPLSVSLLTQRRTRAPRGLAGGGDALPGCQTLFRADGRTQKLASIDAADVEPGDRIVIETPGGGAYGYTGAR
ncbi:MAG: hydantoinase B/oxoprolinase family protein, partial [Myxococcales bacterium]|nr:hydantoinase B/oxoprolinase family protein [Myxococcales bacterium]